MHSVGGEKKRQGYWRTLSGKISAFNLNRKKLAEPTVFGKEKNPHHSAVLGSL